MTSPEEIARKLSPAQKRALLWLPGDRGVRLIDWAEDRELCDALHDLWRLGLCATVVVSAVECSGHGLRALGVQVRVALARLEGAPHA